MLKIKNSSRKIVATPFGAHFATRLTGVNSKLICALSREKNMATGLFTCTDDASTPDNP